jgi:DNA-binding response OmpR family regulator
MEASRILLVEDEKNVGSTLVECLERSGFEVKWCTELEEAKRTILQSAFDLALLDVGLPLGSGFDAAEWLRAKQPGTAIIFLTAFGSPEDRIHGLELGAEDYVVKPFHLKELLLRIQNGLKRAKSFSKPHSLPHTLEEAGSPMVGKMRVHFLRFEAEVEGRLISLSHKEVALLRLLVERRGLVVSRDEILNYAWSADEYPTPRTVDNFIMRLRRLVEVNPEEPQVIKSVRGIGYQLV